MTGANGYVGSIIANTLRKHGMLVVPFSRSGIGASEGRIFRLNDALQPNLLEGIDALVHCAWDLNANNWEDYHAVNVLGSLKLFEAAAKADVRQMVFISTMSAFRGCKSNYGRAKLEVENKAAQWKIHIVRPGLVYGPACRSMMGSLARLTNLPLLPLVGTGNQKLYLVHEEDLSDMVRGMCDGTISRQEKPVVAAHKRPYTLREILKILAGCRRKRPFLMPVPWQLEWLGLKSMETLGLKLRLRSDSLISLINQDYARL